MSEAVDPELIEATRTALSSILDDSPPLTDKSLGRPPFRFIHAIVSTVEAKTGFTAGLFTEDEQNAKAISKDKRAKLTYLKKLVYCVCHAAGSPPVASSSKIAAGVDVKRTLRLLQMLVRVATSGSTDNDDAVRRTLAGEKPGSDGDGGGGGKTSEPAAAGKRAEEPEVSKRPEPTKEPEPEPERPEPAAAAAEPSGGGGGGDGDEWSIDEVTSEPERTHSMFSKLVNMRKFAVKKLSRPPFRYLLDLVNTVSATMDWATDLLTDEERELSKGKPSKAQKLDILSRICNVVSFDLGVPVGAQPSKIAAGVDVDKTNVMLQLLAISARRGNAADAVARVLAGETPPKAGRGSRREASEAPAGGKEGDDDDGGAAAREAEAEAEAARAREERRRKREEEMARRREEEKRAREEAEAAAAAAAAAADEAAAEEDGAAAVDDGAAVAAVAGKEEEDLMADRVTITDRMAEVRDGVRKPLARPSSAGRAPPRLRARAVEKDRPVEERTESARAVGIIRDDEDDDSDDDVVVEGEDGAVDDAFGGAGTEGGAHGRFAREILEAEKKKEEEEKKAAAEGDAEAASTKKGGIRMGRLRKKRSKASAAATADDVDLSALKKSIQVLCQSTNPLGRCLECIPEDLEVMNRELEVWRVAYGKSSDLLEEERRTTDKALKPLREKLGEIEDQISLQHGRVQTLKATVARNNQRIGEMLRMVVTS
eukprot:PLAT16132.1.p1 GENE.PLAT16132.1~~PLAT16132.1.p1  ORF type:complete len:712 (+),score=373.01 PLAT16132.1:66-2201(+)